MLQCPEDRLKHRSLKTQKSLLSALLASSMTFWTSSIWVIMVQRLKAQYREVRPWLGKKKKNNQLNTGCWNNVYKIKCKDFEHEQKVFHGFSNITIKSCKESYLLKKK